MVAFIIFGFVLIGIAVVSILVFTFLPSKAMGDVLAKVRPEENDAPGSAARTPSPSDNASRDRNP